MIEAIGEVRRRNPRADFRPVFAEWKAIVSEAQIELSLGEPRRNPVKRTSELVCAIAEAVAPDRLLDLIAAAHLLGTVKPDRFIGDRCFKLAVVHIVRRAGSVGVARSKTSGRAFYKDLHLGVRLSLFDLLDKSFGRVGEKLAMIEARRRADEAAREVRLGEAVAALM